MSRARSTRAAPRESTARASASERRDTHARAAALYRALLADDPHHAGALQGLARLAMSQSHHDEALALLQRAVARSPGAASLHADLALVLERVGRRDAARAARERALALDPSLAQPLAPDPRWKLGEQLLAEGRAAEAAEQFAALALLHPDAPELRVRLGEAYAAAARADLALEQFAAAARLDPERADALLGIGHVLRAQGRRDEALTAYRAASRARPDHGEAHRWLARLALDDGDSAAALEYARASVSCEPASPAAHVCLASVLLQRGDLREGWAEYAHRLDAREAPSGCGSEWQGEDLRGRRIWVPREPGLSDEILHAGSLPELLATGADAVVECDAALLTLFARSFPAASFVARSGEPPGGPAGAAGARYWAASGSLTARFRPELESFPEPSAYLVPDAAAVAEWRARYAALGRGQRVGLSWRGGRDPAVRRARSSPLAAFARLGKLPGVQLVDLQYGDVGRERAEMRARGLTLHAWDDQPLSSDLDALAARIAALDLVITVDNSTAHLAAALGVPTLVLLPVGADWCWFEERRDSPWYPNVRLYRQTRAGDWAEVLSRVERWLREAGGATPARAASTRPASARALACLVNDTSHSGDWGSAGACRALADELSARGYGVCRVPARGLASLREGPRNVAEFGDPAVWQRVRAANPWFARTIDAASEVVVHDGGAWCRLSRAALDLMYVTYALRVHAGLPVRLVNHACPPARLGPAAPDAAWALRRRVYGVLESIAVRDAETRDRLAISGVRAVLSGDSLALSLASVPLPPAGAPRTGVVLTGLAEADEFPLAAFAALAGAWAGEGLPVTLLRGGAGVPEPCERERMHALAERAAPAVSVQDARTFSDWLGWLRGAQVVVTARPTDAVAAAALGTPVVMLDGARHACDGLAARLASAPPLRLAGPAFEERLEASVRSALDRPAGTAASPAVLERLCRDARRALATVPDVR